MREDAYLDAVLKKCDGLTSCGIWSRDKVRYRAWLQNFREDERPLAAVLLDNFVYLSDRLTDRLVRGAFAKLKASLGTDLADAVFTLIESEDPRPTDSGNIICRKLRQEVGIAKERFYEPTAALELAKQGRPVVFVDDFVGSGEQLRTTWLRPHVGAGSFATARKSKRFRAAYMTLVATDYGLERITSSVPVGVVATHILGAEYDMRRLLRHPLAPTIHDLPDRLHDLFAATASKLDLKDYMRKSDFSLYGFHSLALAFAFEHSVPDATLPILWAEGTDWTPLARRS